MLGAIDKLMGVIAPHTCLGCARDGRLLCATCALQLQTPRPVCYRCDKPSPAGLTCEDCRSDAPLWLAQGAYRYDGYAKSMVKRLKFNYARAAADEMAEFMTARFVPLLRNADTLLVPVPTATSRVRQRGYDQACLLAKAIGRRSPARYAPALIRLGQSQQHGASRQDRLAQARSAYRVVRPELLHSRPIVLVDDVLTTGATFEAAAAAVKAAGSRQIAGIAFARAEVL